MVCMYVVYVLVCVCMLCVCVCMWCGVFMCVVYVVCIRCVECVWYACVVCIHVVYMCVVCVASICVSGVLRGVKGSGPGEGCLKVSTEAWDSSSHRLPSLRDGP